MEDNYEQKEKEEEKEEEEEEGEEGEGEKVVPSEVQNSLPLFSDNPDIGMYKGHA
jgi:hypothetical protein